MRRSTSPTFPRDRGIGRAIVREEENLHLKCDRDRQFPYHNVPTLVASASALIANGILGLLILATLTKRKYLVESLEKVFFPEMCIAHWV